MTTKNFIKFSAKHDAGDMSDEFREYWRLADVWLLDNKGHHGRFYQETRDAIGPAMYDIPVDSGHILKNGIYVPTGAREIMGDDWFQRQCCRLTEFFIDEEVSLISFIGYDNGPGWERWKVDMLEIEQMYLITRFDDTTDAIVYRLSV